MKGLELWKECQKELVEQRDISLGPYYSYSIDHDIKHLGFEFSRYKFAAKMLENRSEQNVLELGCSYGWGLNFFCQVKGCTKAVGVDFDGEAISYAQRTFADDSHVYVQDDFLGKEYTDVLGGKRYNAIISLDVIEHISLEDEELFLKTLDINLKEDGFAVIGTPNIKMNQYASAGGKIGHVNLFDQKRLYDLLSKEFRQVFMFGMNDEVLHTGFYPMCCYIMALCCHKR